MRQQEVRESVLADSSPESVWTIRFIDQIAMLGMNAFSGPFPLQEIGRHSTEKNTFELRNSKVPVSLHVVHLQP